LMQLGFSRILFLIGSSVPNSPWPVLERYAGLIRQFR
jgi:hypothetical protein